MKTQLTAISAEGLKGQNFEQPLSQRNIFIGPNGSGKSARAAAVSLLLLGYVPGIGKQPGTIMSELGTEEKLFITGTLSDGTILLRRLSANEKGGSVDFMINRRRTTKEKFNEALLQAPRVFDLSVFLGLSDQKKIEYLLTLFPAGGDLSEIDQQFYILNDQLNAKRSDCRAKEKMAAELATARAMLNLPTGTLADIRLSIERTAAEYKLTRDNIEIARRRKAEQDTGARATKAAEEKATREAADQQAKKVQQETPKPQKTEPPPPELNDFRSGITGTRTATETVFIDPPDPPSGPHYSITRILNAMSLCQVCAAKIIAKSELRKYEEKF